MIRIAYHELYAHPLPEGHRFPMLKYELIPEQLMHTGLIRASDLFQPEPAAERDVLQTHETSYWHSLRDLTMSAKEQRRIGFPLSSQLIERESGYSC
jgi:acetoin utilization deacetylase AcuC-like enzyme